MRLSITLLCAASFLAAWSTDAAERAESHPIPIARAVALQNEVALQLNEPIENLLQMSRVMQGDEQAAVLGIIDQANNAREPMGAFFVLAILFDRMRCEADREEVRRDATQALAYARNQTSVVIAAIDTDRTTSAANSVLKW